MAQLIVKSPYMKPGGKKQPGRYLKYIATREGIETAEDTSRHLPATDEQQKESGHLCSCHHLCPEGSGNHNRKCSECITGHRSDAAHRSCLALYPTAVLHLQHRVGLLGYGVVVGDDNDGASVFMGKAAQDVHNVVGVGGVQVAGGLVG